jgi:YihY family inner membrane protein
MLVEAFAMPTLPVAGDPDAVKKTALGRIIWTATTAIGYRLVPRKKLRYRYLSAGALVAAVASEAIRVGFSYYLTSVARYDLLYGALGSVFALLLVVYLQALVLLLGAEVAFAWAQSAYPPVPIAKQVRDAVGSLFVRRP